MEKANDAMRTWELSSFHFLMSSLLDWLLLCMRSATDGFPEGPNWAPTPVNGDECYAGRGPRDEAAAVPDSPAEATCSKSLPAWETQEAEAFLAEGDEAPIMASSIVPSSCFPAPKSFKWVGGRRRSLRCRQRKGEEPQRSRNGRGFWEAQVGCGGVLGVTRMRPWLGLILQSQRSPAHQNRGHGKKSH